MLALFFNDTWVHTAALEGTFRRILVSLGRSIPQGDLPGRFRAALKELEGSVLAIENRRVRFANPGLQDFLQRAVMEDKLLPSIIGTVEEFAEVKQAWSAWWAQKPTPSATKSIADAWAGAASRLLHAASGSSLERLALVIDLYDRLQTDQLATLVSEAIDDLSRGEIDGDEADHAQSVLEQLTLSTLPIGLLERAKEAVTAAVATMLQEYGFALSLESIKSVTESLFAHGSDEYLAAKASTRALKDYLQDLNSVLSDITSEDELEEFDQELRSLMNDYGVTDNMATFRIEQRGEELEEYRGWSNDEDRGWSPSSSPGHMSDNEIRSLFGALRER